MKKQKQRGILSWFSFGIEIISKARPSHSHENGTTEWERGTVVVQKRSVTNRRMWLGSGPISHSKENMSGFWKNQLQQGERDWVLEMYCCCKEILVKPNPAPVWSYLFFTGDLRACPLLTESLPHRQIPLGCPLATRDHCPAGPPHSWVRLWYFEQKQPESLNWITWLTEEGKHKPVNATRAINNL